MLRVASKVETSRMGGGIATRVACKAHPSWPNWNHHFPGPWKLGARQRVTNENHEASRTDRIKAYEHEESLATKKLCPIANHVAAGRNEDRIFSLLRKISHLLNCERFRIPHTPIKWGRSSLLRSLGRRRNSFSSYTSYRLSNVFHSLQNIKCPHPRAAYRHELGPIVAIYQRQEKPFIVSIATNTKRYVADIAGTRRS